MGILLLQLGSLGRVVVIVTIVRLSVSMARTEHVSALAGRLHEAHLLRAEPAQVQVSLHKQTQTQGDEIHDMDRIVAL